MLKLSNETKISEKLLAKILLKHTGALVLTLNKSGRIIQFNEACEKISGLTFPQVENKFLWDTVLPPEDADEIRKEAFTNNPKLLSGNYTNLWMTKNEGTVWIDWVDTVVLDELGNVEYLISVGIDVTDKSINEKIIKKHETRLKESQRISKVGSWELDIINNKLFWTDEIFNIFEIDKSEFEASYNTFLHAIHPNDREMVNKAYLDSLHTGEPYQVEHRLIMSDGRIKYVRETCESFFDADGTPLRSVGTIQDITSIHKAESANKSKTEFVSRINHELRTPLNAILGFSQLLQLDSDDKSSQHKSNIKEILDAGNHLSTLINDLLDISLIESGKLNILMEMVPIKKVLKECKALIKFQVKERQINLIDHASKTDQHVYADFTRLKQVLLNILSNAVKYNSKSGSITISSEVINHHLRISIEDTGRGLSKISMSKLFTPFERLDVNDIKGVGIGLIISKSLMEMMDGSIGVESEQGKGTVFWIEFKLSNTI